MPMDIAELKSKKISELTKIAKDMNINGYTDLRKQDLIFKILEAQTEKDGLTFSKGVLEVLPDGVLRVGGASSSTREGRLSEVILGLASRWEQARNATGLLLADRPPPPASGWLPTMSSGW